MKKLLEKENGLYGISSKSMAKLLKMEHNALLIELDRMAAEIGCYVSPDYFLVRDEDSFLLHKGCLELRKRYPDEVEIWDSLDAEFRHVEEENLMKICREILRTYNAKHNIDRKVKMPEKAFLVNGQQYIISDCMIIRFAEAHEDIPTFNKETDVPQEIKEYTVKAIEQGRTLCKEKLHLQANAQRAYKNIVAKKIMNKDEHLYMCSFGNEKPVAYIGFLTDILFAFPTMQFYCTDDTEACLTLMDGFSNTICNYLMKERVIYGKDEYGNECILIDDVTEKEGTIVKNKIFYLPNGYFDFELLTLNNVASLVIPAEIFSYITYEDLNNAIAMYVRKYMRNLKDYEILTDLSFATTLEMLQRTTIKAYQSNLVFKVSPFSDKKRIYVDSYDMNGNLISAFNGNEWQMNYLFIRKIEKTE